MNKNSEVYTRALQKSGYLTERGDPCVGLVTSESPKSIELKGILSDQQVGLEADAVFYSQSTATSIFKDAGFAEPSDIELRRWHEAAWNIAVAPLLWIITPVEVRVYNCYSAQDGFHSDLRNDPIDTFSLLEDHDMTRLNENCGRLATETGAFWSGSVGSRIDRRHRVDRELLNEIKALETKLLALPPDNVLPLTNDVDHDRHIIQRFIGRCIFTWYLLDRGIAQRFLPSDYPRYLPEMFSDRSKAILLFEWLRSTFGGDLFPMDDPGAEKDYLTPKHLMLIQSFANGISLVNETLGQRRLFKFRFDAIPIELISSIYEQFARSSSPRETTDLSLHYTPIELVHLTLDPVFEQLPCTARVIDPTCGSGAFLVEAFRRLVWRSSLTTTLSREEIRNILYTQLFGIDINKAALSIAAFSLYLAALELDENPILSSSDLRFDHLIGRTLFKADTLGSQLPRAVTSKSFDAVIGNPPWTFVKSTGERSEDDLTSKSRPRRSPDHQFLSVAVRLAGETGRIGMVMKATPFFSRDEQAIAARQFLFKTLKPVSLINLSLLRTEGLFPDVTGPAILFFARCKLAGSPEKMLVGSVAWSPTFQRTGVFQVGPGEIHSISLKRVIKTPSLVKAMAFGSARESWLIERLHEEFDSLESVLANLGVSADNRGQGLQVKSSKPSPTPQEYFDLPLLTAKNFTPFTIEASNLESMIHPTLHRPRNRSIFRGPMVVCPKGSFSQSSEKGRYSASVSQNDTLYTESLYGISFADSSVKYARILSGILNSSMTTLQLALAGPSWGLERPTVEPGDLLKLRVPDLLSADQNLLDRVSHAESICARNPNKNGLDMLDQAVFDLYGLEDEERIIATHAVPFAKPLIFDATRERSLWVSSPDSHTMHAYADQVNQTVNAFLISGGRRHLQSYTYTDAAIKRALSDVLPGVTLVRFSMVSGATSNASVDSGTQRDIIDLLRTLHENVGQDAPPYLNEARHLRLYINSDLFIIKPSENRYWSQVAALNDADAILADHWSQSVSR